MSSVIVHYQELTLKGRNRPWFVARLVRSLREATRDLRIKEVRVLMGRIELVLGDDETWERVRDRVANVFGVGNFSRAGRARLDVDHIAALKSATGIALTPTQRDVEMLVVRRA